MIAQSFYMRREDFNVPFCKGKDLNGHILAVEDESL
jgi:hypothetical protein